MMRDSNTPPSRPRLEREVCMTEHLRVPNNNYKISSDTILRDKRGEKDICESMCLNYTAKAELYRLCNNYK